MSTPRTQKGYVFLGRDGKSWHCRFNVHENGKRVQRSRKLCFKDDLHPSKTDHSVLKLAEDFMLKINAANTINDAQPFHNCPLCGNRCRHALKGTFAAKAKREIQNA